jgi:AcrR family transcriptional regulator
VSSVSPRVGARRPGGRSARIRDAVLAATAEVLAEAGYDGLSIEAVAARAGVHKTTVYRRWPTKAELIAETTRERSQQYVPVPDTGSLAGDLTALARAVVGNIGSEIGTNMTRTLVAASSTSREVAEVTAAFWAERLDLTAGIIDRAIERGELPARSDAHLILETLIGPLYVRLLLTGEPIDASFADRVAALVAAGATAGGRS